MLLLKAGRVIKSKSIGMAGMQGFIECEKCMLGMCVVCTYEIILLCSVGDHIRSFPVILLFTKYHMYRFHEISFSADEKCFDKMAQIISTTTNHLPIQCMMKFYATHIKMRQLFDVGGIFFCKKSNEFA